MISKKTTLSVLLILSFQMLFIHLNAQTANEKIVKTAWTSLMAKYAPLAKKGEISVFDINGKQTEWPIWVRDMSSEVLYQEKEIDLIWVDNMKYHYNQSYWESMQKLFKIATALSKTRITSFEDAPMSPDDKETFTKAITDRFGSTKNIYGVTNEQQSPIEYMTVFFHVKNGTAKFIGYFCEPAGY
jgi:hypothetical protein